MALTPLFMRRSVADGPVFGSPHSTAICAPCGRCGSTGTNLASSIGVTIIWLFGFASSAAYAATSAIPVALTAQTASRPRRRLRDLNEMFMAPPRLEICGQSTAPSRTIHNDLSRGQNVPASRACVSHVACNGLLCDELHQQMTSFLAIDRPTRRRKVADGA